MKAILNLLIALIAFSILCAFTTQQPKHAKAPALNTDSIMAEHVMELKMYLSPWVAPDDTSPIDFKAIDSLLSNEHTSVSAQNVITSPDGKLIIFILTEEFCGVYCHNQYASYIHLANGTLLNGGDLLYPVDSIYVLPDGKYLILQSWGERAFEACSDNAQAATVISIKGDSVIPHPEIFKRTAPDNGTGDIVFRTSIEYAATPNFINYYPKTRAIQYQYGKPCGVIDNSPETHTGTFTWQHGVFVQIKDSVWIPTPVPADK